MLYLAAVVGGYVAAIFTWNQYVLPFWSKIRNAL
jgi:hypothetical protein